MQLGRVVCHHGRRSRPPGCAAVRSVAVPLHRRLLLCLDAAGGQRKLHTLCHCMPVMCFAWDCWAAAVCGLAWSQPCTWPWRRRRYSLLVGAGCSAAVVGFAGRCCRPCAWQPLPVRRAWCGVMWIVGARCGLAWQCVRRRPGPPPECVCLHLSVLQQQLVRCCGDDDALTGRHVLVT